MVEYLYSYLNKICSHAYILSLVRCMNLADEALRRGCGIFLLDIAYLVASLYPGW